MNKGRLAVREAIRGPIYSEGQVPTSYCARYARMAAKDLFGLDYPVAHAWKIRSFPEIEAIPFKTKGEFEDFARAGLLRPGMLVGFYFPWTFPENRANALKEGVDYTHMALLTDTDSEGGPFFADKFKAKTRPRISFSRMCGLPNLLKPREVLYIRDHPVFNNV